MDGLCFGKRPNGHGGAGLPVLPPMGLTALFGAGDDGEDGVEGSATAVGERAAVTPAKPPGGSHDLRSCSGLLDASRFAAAPIVATVSEDAATLIAGAAMFELGGEGQCGADRMFQRRMAGKWVVLKMCCMRRGRANGN